MFKLEFECVEKLCSRDTCDETISEAIETNYNASDSKIKLFWNSQIVDIDWKYDISDIFLDILKMINLLSSPEENISFTLMWPSSSFMATWLFDAREHNLTITSRWVAVCGGKEKLKELRSVSDVITLNKEEFISYWDSLVSAVEKDLKSAGYDYESLLQADSIRWSV